MFSAVAGIGIVGSDKSECMKFDGKAYYSWMARVEIDLLFAERPAFDSDVVSANRISRKTYTSLQTYLSNI